ncbi:hypothetical protein VCHENC02_0229B, partial [Vibrio harveyi]
TGNKMACIKGLNFLLF